MMHWYFIVAAALGAVLRYLVDFYLPRRGILLVNIVGSCVAGTVLGLAWFQIVHQDVAAILLGGFAGSLTTFSTVALATVQQEPGTSGKAISLWVQHVGLSILACVIGLLSSIWLFS